MNPTQAAVDRAIRAVNRLVFLPPGQQRHAGDDTPLPIGHGQTTSQPSLIEEMTRELALTERARVLEIGTGSGYQTAILAQIAARVYTIERVPELAALARERLNALGYVNIEYRVGDGALGWPDAAPFEAIIVTAAPRVIPPLLVEQLAPSGRMVIPVGVNVHDQTLMLVTKDNVGAVCTQALFGVRFVPLISDTGEPG